MNIILPTLYVCFLLFSRLVAPGFEVVAGFKEVHSAIFNSLTALVIFYVIFRYFNITKKDAIFPVLGFLLVYVVGFFFNPIATMEPIIPLLTYSGMGAFLGGLIGRMRQQIA